MSTTSRTNNPTGSGYFDLDALVNKVADRFEAQFRPATVSKNARHALVSAMLPHVEQVKADLVAGRVTYKSLEETLLGVLSTALEQLRTNVEAPVGGAVFLKDVNRVDDMAVQKAMKKKCSYLGWC